MRLSRFAERLIGWVKPGLWSKQSPISATRGSVAHVIILDGTMSSLEPGRETNAGLAFRLLSKQRPQVSVYYEAGVQWQEWRHAPDVLMGRGINRQIRRAYGYLSCRYRPGDKVFLLGYSRGAYAVRSLAGVVDQVGLLRPECATERNIQTAYRHYQSPPGSPASRAFRKAHCHDRIDIEMVGVWDTVKALGVRLPFLWQWAEQKHAFHSHELGSSTKFGFQALALNEDREVFEPVLWDSTANAGGRIEQVWFRGSHGDIGGQVESFPQARPLSNIPFVWLMEKAESCGLPLPNGWQKEFPTDPDAPSLGTWRGWGKLFLLRQNRVIGDDPSERLHDSVPSGTLPTSWQQTV